MHMFGAKAEHLLTLQKLELSVPDFAVLNQASDGRVKLLFAPPECQLAVSGMYDLAELTTERLLGRNAIVSVRSSPEVSMPGMLDTILNVGLNDETVQKRAITEPESRFAWDCYRRLLQSYGEIVLGVEGYDFEDILEEVKLSRGMTRDGELTAEDWQSVAERFLTLIELQTDVGFPQDPSQQLIHAIDAVFSSWETPRARSFRNLNGISHTFGMSVIVQKMVFGNKGDKCGTGVAFTRNPSTGERTIYGEFMQNAQGHDIVAGIHTPGSLSERDRQLLGSEMPSLEARKPSAFEQLQEVCRLLEAHFRDMQEVEFTIDEDRLWILQTRPGKRSLHAGMRIASDMFDEKLTTNTQALRMVDPWAMSRLLSPTIDPDDAGQPIAKGLPASPGAARGLIAFNLEEAKMLNQSDASVVLVRNETSPNDIQAMALADGILTTRGGTTSHAAVVARGMGKPCVVGALHLEIDEKNGRIQIGDRVLSHGSEITIDGMTGQVFEGGIRLKPPELPEYFKRLTEIASVVRKTDILVEIQSSEDAQAAINLGCNGISVRSLDLLDHSGCCRELLSKGYKLADRSDRIRMYQQAWKLLDPKLLQLIQIANGRSIQVYLNGASLCHGDPASILNNGGDPEKRDELLETQVNAILQLANQLDPETAKQTCVTLIVPAVCSAEDIVRVRKMIVGRRESEYRNDETNAHLQIGAEINSIKGCSARQEIANSADVLAVDLSEIATEYRLAAVEGRDTNSDENIDSLQTHATFGKFISGIMNPAVSEEKSPDIGFSAPNWNQEDLALASETLRPAFVQCHMMEAPACLLAYGRLNLN